MRWTGSSPMILCSVVSSSSVIGLILPSSCVSSPNLFASSLACLPCLMRLFMFNSLFYASRELSNYPFISAAHLSLPVWASLLPIRASFVDCKTSERSQRWIKVGTYQSRHIFSERLQSQWKAKMLLAMMAFRIRTQFCVGAGLAKKPRGGVGGWYGDVHIYGLLR